MHNWCGRFCCALFFPFFKYNFTKYAVKSYFAKCCTKHTDGSSRSIVIVIIITFVTMIVQGVYKCIPETDLASRVYTVAAVLYLQFVLHVMLFRMLNIYLLYVSTYRSMFTLPSMLFFCNFLIS